MSCCRKHLHLESVLIVAGSKPGAGNKPSRRAPPSLSGAASSYPLLRKAMTLRPVGIKSPGSPTPTTPPPPGPGARAQRPENSVVLDAPLGLPEDTLQTRVIRSPQILDTPLLPEPETFSPGELLPDNMSFS